ncbi:sigma-70 family RNA polymerase sigma factor [Paraburkholderia sp. BR13439]|uniref:sigma-70 family RNA polymerase sigma factor n=1 Tax=Paraburkholderia sp. BR13439 TaxID=3236996 RepID=UPI0034CE1264
MNEFSAVSEQRIGGVFGRRIPEAIEHSPRQRFVFRGLFGFDGVAHQCQSLHDFFLSRLSAPVWSDNRKDDGDKLKDAREINFSGPHPLGERERLFDIGVRDQPEDSALDANELTQLMAAMRPRLHRYCTRMMGSAFDGEDVVQETLSNAVAACSAAGEILHPESWLLAIAHHAALDALRRRKRQGHQESDEALENLTDHGAQADARVAATASLAMFLHLSVVQRSCVVLADVLGYSLTETAAILSVSVPSVKAALHRGRGRLRELVGVSDAALPRLAEADLERLRAYAERFNARDFDALRDLLAEEVRLDLVSRARLAGRKDVSVYFTRYAESTGCSLSLGWAEHRPVLLATDPVVADAGVAYVILLDWTDDDRIIAIRDFRFAPYVMESLTVQRL